MRRAATVLLTAALTTGGLATLAPPASADIVARHLTIAVTNLGPEHRTCRIDADLYIPDGVSSPAPGSALLVTNGFGGTKDDQKVLAQGFGEQGYVTPPTPASASSTATTDRSPSTTGSPTVPRPAS